MKEIRVRWPLGLHRGAHGAALDGGAWLLDTPDNRRDLQIIVEEGCKVGGAGSHWIEERDARKLEVVPTKPHRASFTGSPLDIVGPSATPISPAYAQLVRTASSGASSDCLMGEGIIRFAALMRAQAFEDAALIVETAPDLLQNSTFDGVAAVLRAEARAAAKQGGGL